MAKFSRGQRVKVKNPEQGFEFLLDREGVVIELIPPGVMLRAYEYLVRLDQPVQDPIDESLEFDWNFFGWELAPIAPSAEEQFMEKMRDLSESNLVDAFAIPPELVS